MASHGVACSAWAGAAQPVAPENPAHLDCDAIVGVVFRLKIPKTDVLRVRAAAIDCRVRAGPIAYSRMIDRDIGESDRAHHGRVQADL